MVEGVGIEAQGLVHVEEHDVPLAVVALEIADAGIREPADAALRAEFFLRGPDVGIPQLGGAVPEEGLGHEVVLEGVAVGLGGPHEGEMAEDEEGVEQQADARETCVPGHQENTTVRFL